MSGNTLFVLPEQVPATLAEGFSRINALADPVARALTTMFERGMARIHDWTSRFDYNRPLHDLQELLGGCNTFKEDLKTYRLIFPENSASTER